METKQVIVVRTKYPDGKGGTFKPRTGKLCAHASHASCEFLIEAIYPIWKGMKSLPHTSKQILNWIETGRTKICVSVQSEEELLEIYNNAKKAGLQVYLITDAGKTEFHGVPTKTALAIGPDEVDKINKVTGHLPLM